MSWQMSWDAHFTENLKDDLDGLLEPGQFWISKLDDEIYQVHYLSEIRPSTKGSKLLCKRKETKTFKFHADQIEKNFDGNKDELVAYVRRNLKLIVAFDFDQTLTGYHTWPGHGEDEPLDLDPFDNIRFDKQHAIIEALHDAENIVMSIESNQKKVVIKNHLTEWYGDKSDKMFPIIHDREFKDGHNASKIKKLTASYNFFVSRDNQEKKDDEEFFDFSEEKIIDVVSVYYVDDCFADTDVASRHGVRTILVNLQNNFHLRRLNECFGLAFDLPDEKYQKPTPIKRDDLNSIVSPGQFSISKGDDDIYQVHYRVEVTPSDEDDDQLLKQNPTIKTFQFNATQFKEHFGGDKHKLLAYIQRNLKSLVAFSFDQTLTGYDTRTNYSALFPHDLKPVDNVRFEEQHEILKALRDKDNVVMTLECDQKSPIVKEYLEAWYGDESENMFEVMHGGEYKFKSRLEKLTASYRYLVSNGKLLDFSEEKTIDVIDVYYVDNNLNELERMKKRGISIAPVTPVDNFHLQTLNDYFRLGFDLPDKPYVPPTPKKHDDNKEGKIEKMTLEKLYQQLVDSLFKNNDLLKKEFEVFKDKQSVYAAAENLIAKLSKNIVRLKKQAELNEWKFDNKKYPHWQKQLDEIQDVINTTFNLLSKSLSFQSYLDKTKFISGKPSNLMRNLGLAVLIAGALIALISIVCTTHYVILACMLSLSLAFFSAGSGLIIRSRMHTGLSGAMRKFGMELFHDKHPDKKLTDRKYKTTPLYNTNSVYLNPR